MDRFIVDFMLVNIISKMPLKSNMDRFIEVGQGSTDPCG